MLYVYWVFVIFEKFSQRGYTSTNQVKSVKIRQRTQSDQRDEHGCEDGDELHRCVVFKERPEYDDRKAKRVKERTGSEDRKDEQNECFGGNQATKHKKRRKEKIPHTYIYHSISGSYPILPPSRNAESS